MKFGALSFVAVIDNPQVVIQGLIFRRGTTWFGGNENNFTLKGQEYKSKVDTDNCSF